MCPRETPSQHRYHRPRVGGLQRMCPGPQKWPGLHASEDGELTTFPHSLLPSLGIPDHVRKSFCALSQNLPLGPGAVQKPPNLPSWASRPEFESPELRRTLGVRNPEKHLSIPGWSCLATLMGQATRLPPASLGVLVPLLLLCSLLGRDTSWDWRWGEGRGGGRGRREVRLGSSLSFTTLISSKFFPFLL